MSRAPFKLKAPEPLEAEIQQQCVKVLDRILAPPVEFACYPAGAAQLSPAQHARYSRLGLKRGWPDLMVAAPKGMFGLECKRKGQRLSKTYVTYNRRGSPKILVGQEEMFPRLLNSGGFVDIQIIHSVDEMVEQLRKWEIPLRPNAELLGVGASLLGRSGNSDDRAC